MKAFLQNVKFKLGTVWWDVLSGNNKYIWRAIIVLSASAGILLGKAL